jgi:uncharacterized membrane protein YgcG
MTVCSSILWRVRVMPVKQVVLLAVLCGAMCPAAAGQVRDDADILSPQGERAVEQRIDAIRQRTGHTVAVETYPEIPAEQRAAYEAARNKGKFFDDWTYGRGAATKVDVLLLINMKPAHVQIGAAERIRQAGLFRVADRRRVLDEMLVPALKAKDYDRGVASAVDAIGAALTRNAGRSGSTPVEGSAGAGAAGGAAGAGSSSPSSSPPAPAPRGAPTAGICGMGSISGWLCAGVAALAIFVVLRGFARRRAMQSGVGGTGYGGQPGYGQPGYPAAGGGGGFGRGLLGGLLGGMLGGAAYDHFRHGGSQADATPTDPNAGLGAGGAPPDTGFAPGPNDFESSSGADFDSGGGGGGDFGGSSGSDF